MTTRAPMRAAAPRRLAGLVLASGLALAGAGCFGKSPTARLYALTPTAARAPGAAVTGPALGLGPVTLPAYLDRPQVVTRRSADEVAAAEFDRWAEPLAEAVPRILGENLAALLGTERIQAYPWPRTRPVAQQVTVEVLRFEGRLGGEVSLVARWRVLDSVGRELLVQRSVIQEPSGGDHAALVAAMSRALGTLSRELAEAVRGR
jgi:uncharacterized lipoprotein YmbA